jgi:hypothetical protein
MKLPDDYQIDKGILELESKIGVPPKFFLRLNDADDWTFVIKLHALFEAACTHLLLHHLQEPELASVISRLELSNKATGKIAFLTKLGLIGKDNRRYISTLSELRNSLVHDVRNHEFSLPDLVAGLTQQALQNMAVAYSPYEAFVREHFAGGEALGLELGQNLIEQSEPGAVTRRFKADPKYHMWIGAHAVLISLVDQYDYSDYLRWSRSDKGSDFPDELV